MLDRLLTTLRRWVRADGTAFILEHNGDLLFRGKVGRPRLIRTHCSFEEADRLIPADYIRRGCGSVKIRHVPLESQHNAAAIYRFPKRIDTDKIALDFANAHPAAARFREVMAARAEAADVE